MPDPNVNWSQADSLAKAIDQTNDVWHSGHVNDALPLPGGGFVVATDTGGVWILSPSGAATPVSADWQSPEMRCLAAGANGASHFYSGGGHGVGLSDPKIVSASFGQVDVFAIGDDFGVWHSTFDGNTHPWESLGGDGVGEPAVVSWGGGRIDLFVIGSDEALYHKWFDGTAWQPGQADWEPLGGTVVGGPAAITPASGQLEVFAIGPDGSLNQRYFDGTQWLPTNGWNPLGAPPNVRFLGSPRAIFGGNRLDLFAIGDDDRVYHRARVAGTLDPQWQSIGLLSFNVRPIGNPTIALVADASPAIVVVGSDGNAYFKSLLQTGWYPSPDGWQPLGNPTSDSTPPLGLVGTPTCAGAHFSLDIVVTDLAGNEWHRHGDGLGNWDDTWDNLGGTFAGASHAILPVGDAFQVVTSGTDANVYLKKQSKTWVKDGWAWLGAPTTEALHETDVTDTLPLLKWRAVPIPTDAGGINRIVVVPGDHPRIVIACDNGIFWSPIPPAGSPASAYQWTLAKGAPRGQYSGLARSGSAGVVAAAGYSDVGGGRVGFFVGTFEGGDLVCTQGQCGAIDARDFGRVSVASGASAEIIQAVAHDPRDYFSADPPTLVSWSPGRLDVFCRGVDGDIQHRGGDGDNWGAWESIGGTAFAPSAAVSWGLNRIDVFALGTDQQIYWKWFDGSNWQPSQTGWTSLGGTCVGQPVAVSWGNNRIDLFAMRTDGAIVWQTFDGTNWSQTWTAIDAGLFVGSFAATTWGPNRLDLFAIGLDGTMQHRWWDGNAWQPSGQWEQLTTDQVWAPAAVWHQPTSSAPATIDLFARGGDGTLQWRHFDGTNWLPSSGWQGLDSGVMRGTPSPVAWLESSVDVFVRADNPVSDSGKRTFGGNIRRISYDGANWSPWQDQGGNLGVKGDQLPVGDPSAIARGSLTDVFALAVETDDDGSPTAVFQKSYQSGDVRYDWTDRQGNLSLRQTGIIDAVMRSVDGGASWAATGLLVTNTDNKQLRQDLRVSGGNQGDYNYCISVDPNDTNLVAIGWRAGPFISKDGGDTWLLNSDQTSPHLHSDVHLMRFVPGGARAPRLLVGTDGGFVFSDDLGATWTSDFNRQILSLQFEGQQCFSASGTSPGVVAGALQDNGDVWTVIGPTAHPWLELDNSDGTLASFSNDGRLIYADNVRPQARVATWDGTQLSGGDTIPIAVNKPGSSPDPKGLQSAVVVNVNNPKWKNHKHQVIQAVGAVGLDVFGLFPASGGFEWQYLGSINAAGASITALGSDTGITIFVGTNQGSIFAFDSPSGSGLQLNVVPELDWPGTIQRFIVESDTHVFALMNVGGDGRILRLNGLRWDTLRRGLPNTSFQDGDRDWTVSPQTLFVATDRRVYSSRDDGVSFQPADSGLPRRVKGNNLRFLVKPGTGGRFLYMATYGRSVWRARVQPAVAPAVGVAGLIQSNYPKGQQHGNFEALIFGNGMITHYWHDNSDVNKAWNNGVVVSTNATGPAAFIQGNYPKGADHGNFEAVVLEGRNLVHYWRDQNLNWNRGVTISTSAIGPGCMIQSDFPRGSDHGNFEVLVPEDGGLAHYYRDNGGNLQWHFVTFLPVSTTQQASFIQGDYEKGAEHKNFDAVVIEGDSLVHLWCDNAGGTGWQRGVTIVPRGVAGPASLIQSDYTKGADHKNFELVVPIRDRGLVHFWRDNAGNLQWNEGPVVASGATGSATLIQSDFGRPASGHGNLEVLVVEGLSIVHHWRNDGDNSLQWGLGQIVATDE